MSTILTKLDRERTLANVNKFQYTDEDAIEDINDKYHYIIRQISYNIPDYFYDTGKALSVSGQSEYTAEELLGTPNIRIKKVNKVFCKYKSTDLYPTKLKEKAPADLVEHTSFYENWKGEPFYVERDNSVFVYPSPSEDIEAGIELDCIYTPVDLSLEDNVKMIKFPNEYHNILFKGLRENMFLSNEDENRGEKARNVFETNVKQLITELLNLKNRMVTPYIDEDSLTPYK